MAAEKATPTDGSLGEDEDAEADLPTTSTIIYSADPILLVDPQVNTNFSGVLVT